MLIGSFLLSGIKTYGGINMLNCAEMKIIIKLYIAENSCHVKVAHETAFAITPSLPASEGKALILNNLLLQEPLICPVLLHYFIRLLSSPAVSKPPWGTYVLHLLQLKIILMNYRPSSIHNRSNFGRLKLVSAIMLFVSQFICRYWCFKKRLTKMPIM